LAVVCGKAPLIAVMSISKPPLELGSSGGPYESTLYEDSVNWRAYAEGATTAIAVNTTAALTKRARRVLAKSLVI
jgi:hypothetical protein